MFFEEENELQENAKKEREILEKKIVASVNADFQRRREERRRLESGWVLNMNFLSGNQYCDVSPFGGVEQEDKKFFWQSRRVFNHIAPAIDSRLAKLAQLRPQLRVRAFSDEEGDVKAARLATGLLAYVNQRIKMDETISKGTVWSEVCGSVFYKIVWDENGGRQIAVDENSNPVYEGEVSVEAVSPFEIYPDSLAVEDFDKVQSLIHAQTVSVDYIKEKFGVEVQGATLSGLEAGAYSEPSAGKLPVEWKGAATAPRKDSVVLIERYTLPSSEYKDGRLEIVAGDRLLYVGGLPYLNGEKGTRIFPFVKQDCLRLPGAFFGCSIVDRLIPVQRAYNAVRNRKHEFLNRLSMGILAVEDGSVDADELAEEGLAPGKVVVYRQGGKAPEVLSVGNVPNEFKDEEEWLEKEFSLIGGVSDLTQNSTPMRVTSATGLQLLLSQDELRLQVTLDSLCGALKEIGRHILRLYRQFAGTARLMTLTGENKRVQVHYFNAGDLSASDIVFETEDATTPYEKRETLLKLLDAGVLSGDDGKLTKENKVRFLEAFGFGSYENAQDISALHAAKATEENLKLIKERVDADEYDDHQVHIAEHTRFLLGEEFKKTGTDDMKARFVQHIKNHREKESI